jgi:hypothetical protein
MAGLQMVVTTPHAPVLQSRQQKEEELRKQAWDAKLATIPSLQLSAALVSWGERDFSVNTAYRVDIQEWG